MWYGNLAFSSSALPFPARFVGLTGIDDPYKFLLLECRQESVAARLLLAVGCRPVAVAAAPPCSAAAEGSWLRRAGRSSSLAVRYELLLCTSAARRRFAVVVFCAGEHVAAADSNSTSSLGLPDSMAAAPRCFRLPPPAAAATSRGSALAVQDLDLIDDDATVAVSCALLAAAAFPFPTGGGAAPAGGVWTWLLPQMLDPIVSIDDSPTASAAATFASPSIFAAMTTSETPHTSSTSPNSAFPLAGHGGGIILLWNAATAPRSSLHAALRTSPPPPPAAVISPNSSVNRSFSSTSSTGY
uniref:Uncharacterized protein n=1 Tax=Oryza nivara TaxID=4536 RepID=A0A0E0JC98_ORYNI